MDGACKVYFQQVEQDCSKVALADLASLLEDSVLRDVKTQLWKRYRLRFPADVHPSDAVVSRVSRELPKRMLCVFSVWKVGSLQFQMGSSQRKRKSGEGLFTEKAETEEVVSHDCDTYLQKLHMRQFYGACGGNFGRAVAILLQGTEVYLMSAGKRVAWLQHRGSEEAEWITR